jgi:cyclic pyranopterin phosphate synthase
MLVPGSLIHEASWIQAEGRSFWVMSLTQVKAATVAGIPRVLAARATTCSISSTLMPMARLAMHEGLQVRFIEFMPYKNNSWDVDQFIPARDILARVQEGLGVELQEEPAINLEEGPARLFAIPGSVGKVGVISTLSADFCDRCNRVRLTSRGEMKACLFGNASVDLLELLRNHATTDDLTRLIRQTMSEKLDCHPMRHGDQPILSRGMWQVGG